MLDLIIKNGTAYIANSLKKQDIGIKDGKIVRSETVATTMPK